METPRALPGRWDAPSLQDSRFIMVERFPRVETRGYPTLRLRRGYQAELSITLPLASCEAWSCAKTVPLEGARIVNAPAPSAEDPGSVHAGQMYGVN